MAVDDDDDDDDAEVDDMLASIIPSEKAPAATTTTDVPAASTATATTTTATATPTPAPAEAPAPPVATAAPSSQPTQTDQTLRSRATPSYAEARAALFANRRRAAGDDAPDKAAATTGSTTATAEAILDQQSAEREDLAAKVFQLAQAMKRQQMEMADSLESEKDVLGRATEGMERTGRGMDAAKGRMGALVRMTEGKGWWGRVILYAWVYGLMVALVLLVLVLPKLRF